MHPLLFELIPLYFVMWVCAALCGGAVGTAVAVRAGFPAGRSAAAITLLALSILAGSKLLYLAEAHWFPLDDYVPPEMRAAAHGFRIPGGILLLALAMPLVCGSLRLPWRQFGDTVIPLAALALVFIRLGCFLNGCCFGRVSAVPWAIRFPRGGWVFWYHASHGWLAASASFSQPVHPLQLYFLAAAVLTLGLLVRYRLAAPYSGFLQLLFYGLFFSTTELLEPLRQNYLTLNSWLAPASTAIAAISLVLGRVVARLEPSPATLNNESTSRSSRYPPVSLAAEGRRSI